MSRIAPSDLTARGMEPAAADALVARLGALDTDDPLAEWRRVAALLEPAHSYAVHRYLHQQVFAHWPPAQGPAPVWVPGPEEAAATHLARLQADLGLDSYADLHAWSTEHREEYWQQLIDDMGIVFSQPPQQLVDLGAGVTAPEWLPGARLNIVDSCFQAEPQQVAVIHQPEGGDFQTTTYQELSDLVDRVANGLTESGFAAGEALAIAMPMTLEAVAIYLGIVKAGCVAVSIADSFSPQEMATRLRLGGAAGIFTQDEVLRSGRRLALFQKVVAADGPRAVVIPAGEDLVVDLRDGDLRWADFLSTSPHVEAVQCSPGDATNLLFSSGTTGEPKAIPWTHTSPIKAAADGRLHHDIQPGNVVAWPTNLGWMMGPWLIYASLINRATMALYYGSPTGWDFCRFVQDAGVQMLGVVPSMVKAWRKSRAAEDLDWSRIRAFSSTGECSNRDDMHWLSAQARYRPVIEYCGGTEIGGGYITGTLVQPQAPAAFSTPALGLDFVILDEAGHEADQGELFLIPPSLGLSTTLYNRDHHQVYFAGTPAGPNGETLRRHGDQMERLGGGYYRAHGRVDDTMNLGGIKVSSAEIERVLNKLEGVRETAAVAVSPPGGGPEELHVFVIGERQDGLLTTMRREVKHQLNPLFKVKQIHYLEALPRTASNKVMRRLLRRRLEGGEAAAS